MIAAVVAAIAIGVLHREYFLVTPRARGGSGIWVRAKMIAAGAVRMQNFENIKIAKQEKPRDEEKRQKIGNARSNSVCPSWTYRMNGVSLGGIRERTGHWAKERKHSRCEVENSPFGHATAGTATGITTATTGYWLSEQVSGSLLGE